MRRIDKKQHNVGFDGLLSFILASICITSMFALSGIYPFGKIIILQGDSLEQYISYIQMAIRNLLNGESLYYSFTISMGLNTSLILACFVLSPLNAIFFIFRSVDVNILTMVLVVLKTGLSATCFCLFSKCVLKGSRVSTIVFSIFYAMCAYSVVLGFINFMWMDGLYILPLVALSVYVAAKKDNYIYLVISHAYIFIVHCYMGYMIGIFSLLFFILLTVLENKNDMKSNIIKITNFFFSILIAAAISAIIWLPFAFFLFRYSASDRTSFTYISTNIFYVINNLFWGEVQDYSTAPYIYCGIPTLMIAPFYFLSRGISKKEKFISGILLCFFVLGCVFLPLYEVLHAFDAPDSWNYRFSFIISFILCSIAVRGSKDISDVKPRQIAIEFLILVFVYLIVQRLQEFEIDYLTANSNIGFVINGTIFFAWILALWMYKKRKKISIWFIIVLCLVEVVSNGFFCLHRIDFKESGEEISYFSSWEKDMDEVLFRIKERESVNMDFYRTLVYYDILHNGDTYWGYNGISDFSTSENEKLRDFNAHMGLYTSSALTYGTGITPPIEMLYAIRYIATIYPHLEESDSEDNLVQKNTIALPLSYMSNSDAINNISFDGNVFENQNKVFYSLSGIESVWSRIPYDDIYIEEQGLILSDDGKRIIKKNKGAAEMKFHVKDRGNPIYLMVLPEDPDEHLGGIWYEMPSNLVNLMADEIMISVPHIASMDYVDGEYCISIGTNDYFAGTMNIDDVYIYELDMEKLQEIYTYLNSEPFEISEWKNGYVKGQVTVSDDRRVLMTSIPRIDGWHAYVNSEKYPISTALNDTFLSIELPGEGEYEIIFLYECPGLKASICISIVGLMFFVWCVIKNSLKRRKNDDDRL